MSIQIDDKFFPLWSISAFLHTEKSYSEETSDFEILFENLTFKGIVFDFVLEIDDIWESEKQIRLSIEAFELGEGIVLIHFLVTRFGNTE